MTRRALALLALATLLPALGAADAASAPQWTALFDGRTKAGWRMSGPGRFSVERGALVSHGGMGLLWFARRRFADFELEVDWKVASSCDNSGIFVRFPRRPRSPVDAVSSGYEVQIDDCDPRDGPYRTGAIYDHAAPARAAARPAGQWNRYRIRVVGQRYTVVLNGITVTRFRGARSRLGYVGLQNHDAGSRVSFRRIRARPLG
jgi:Domain of Unknown Function (DUF1080)